MEAHAPSTVDEPGARCRSRRRSEGDPELALVLGCAASHLKDACPGELTPLLERAIEWDRVVELARRHGTVPLLYHGLTTSTQERVPQDLMTALRGRFHEVGRRNLYQIVELLRVLEDLRRARIPAIPFKGPILAERVYGNLGLREFSDLDVLVRPRDVDRAARVLEGSGYTPWYPPSGGEHRAAREADYALPFSRARDRMSVDLHWAFAKRFFAAAVDEELVWGRAEKGTIQRQDVLLLPRPLVPIVLAVHGAKHGPYPWPRLKWIADMAGVVETGSSQEWRDALALAGDLGVVRMLLLGVSLAERVLGARVPSPLARALAADQTAERLAEKVEEWLLFDPRPAPTFAERASFDVSVRERYRDRARYVARRLVTPTPRDRGAVRLPPRLSFLYPLLRWVRLLGRYARHPGHLARLWRGVKGADAPTTGTERAA